MSNHTFFATPVIDDEVKSYLKHLPTRKAAGYDGIHPHFLKCSNESVIKALTHIFNKSIETGIFPDNLKTAKVIPVHKGGQTDFTNNYRPISLLPVISKVFEKLMHKRIVSFLEHCDFFCQSQYGFRKNRNTNLAVSDIVNDLNINIDQGLLNIGVFLDFRKAFDTVDHNILLNKLYAAGIRGTTNSWFQSYLSERKQFVQLGNETSTNLPVTRGVPQGSI